MDQQNEISDDSDASDCFDLRTATKMVSQPAMACEPTTTIKFDVGYMGSDSNSSFAINPLFEVLKEPDQSNQARIDSYSDENSPPDKVARINGTPNSPSKVEKQKRGSKLRNARSILDSHCCFNSCLKHFSEIQIADIEEKNIRQSFHIRKHQQVQILASQQLWISESNTFMVNVAGHEICQTAFKILFNISEYMWGQMKSYQLSGHSMGPQVHGNTGKRKLSRSYNTAHEWMSQFVAVFGERLPHVRKRICIAAFKHKSEVYEQLKAELVNRDYSKEQICSKHTFYRMLRHEFQDLKVGEALNMAYCSDCAKIALMRREAKTKEALAVAKRVQELHIGHVKSSHQKLTEIKVQARNPQYDIDCIMIDGMDQNKTGGLIYSEANGGEEPSLFFDFLQVPKDPNLTIAILMDLILMKETPVKQRLWVQMDNCVSENKNRYLLSFCGVLVHFGVYDEVTVMFHPVGFAQRMERCYRPNPKVGPIPTVYDLKKWLSQFLPPEAEFRGFTNYHLFQIRKDTDGEVKIRWKYYSNTEWLPKDKPSYTLFKNHPDLSCVPDTVVPSLTSDVPLKNNLAILQQDIPDQYATRLNAEEKRWWTTFLHEGIHEYLKVPPSSSVWPLLDILARVRSERGNRTETDDLSDENLVTENDMQLDRGLKKLARHVLGIGIGHFEIGQQGRVNRIADGDPSSIAKDNIVLVRPDLSQMSVEEIQGLVEQPWIGKVVFPMDAETKCLTVAWLYSSNRKLSGAWTVRKGKGTQQEIPASSVMYWETKRISGNKLSARFQGYVRNQMSSAIEMEARQCDRFISDSDSA